MVLLNDNNNANTSGRPTLRLLLTVLSLFCIVSLSLQIHSFSCVGLNSSLLQEEDEDEPVSRNGGSSSNDDDEYYETDSNFKVTENSSPEPSPSPVAIAKHRIRGPSNKLFPKRLFTVFGLESSGTKFLAATLGMATGTLQDFAFVERTRNPLQTIEVQHISLPFGSACVRRRGRASSSSFKDIFAVVPAPCMSIEKDENHPFFNPAPPIEECKQAGLGRKITYPQRFFVNITSHIQWYASHGVEATAVVLVRDSTINEVGNIHCRDKVFQREEMDHGKDIIKEAIVKLDSSSPIMMMSTPDNERHHLVPPPPPQIVLVSYESIMALQDQYLFRLYQQLGIESRYVPEFRDGNLKYVAKKGRPARVAPSKWN